MKPNEALPKLTEEFFEAGDKALELFEEYLKWLGVPKEIIKIVGTLQYAAMLPVSELEEIGKHPTPKEAAAHEISYTAERLTEITNIIAAALDGVKKSRLESCARSCPIYSHLEAQRPHREGLN